MADAAVPNLDPVAIEIAVLKERMRVMENMVHEFRSDLKEIKQAVQISAGQKQTYGKLFEPMVSALWIALGAIASAYFFGHHL